MKRMTRYIAFWLLYSLPILATGQEFTAPLMLGASEETESTWIPKKTTALALPFFEDFCQQSRTPSSERWVDRQVYVNHTMGVGMLSCGVATFDALNAQGRPYHTQSNTVVLRADSLTSQPIDLSLYQPSDSLYLSFYFQPQGNGYYPEVHDSLMLYFRDTLNWRRIWAVPGRSLHDFHRVMIPISDGRYFHDRFAMRWVNKASINTNDDHWHLDYILLDRGRHAGDTLIEDIAFTASPNAYLSRYTAMPYHQFLAQPDQERGAGFDVPIRNLYQSPQTVSTGYQVRDTVGGQVLHSSTLATVNLGPDQTVIQSYPGHSSLPPSSGRYLPQVWEHKFFIDAPGKGPTSNDSLVRHTHFGNYYAYDDGTAEKSYYLKLFPSLPGKIAIAYELNEPDTLTGMAIYFGRQVPSAENKFFSLVIYDQIVVGSREDRVVYQQDFLQPGYLNTNAFYYYRFDRPVPLLAGTFYAGVTMPAMSNSDSLYFGLDIQRAADNYLYYNVIDRWVSSGIGGALMIRPVLGPMTPSFVSESQEPDLAWTLFPNPVVREARVQFSGFENMEFRIFDLQGRPLRTGTIRSGEVLDLGDLAPGTYLMQGRGGGRTWPPRRLVKW